MKGGICPECSSTNYSVEESRSGRGRVSTRIYTCDNCGHTWKQRHEIKSADQNTVVADFNSDIGTA